MSHFVQCNLKIYIYICKSLILPSARLEITGKLYSGINRFPSGQASLVFVYTLSEACSGVNWADLMAAQAAFGTDFYDRSILRPKHRAYTIVW